MTGQRDDYTTDFVLDYIYYKENYKLIAVDYSEKQAVDVDRKAIQRINFNRNLEQTGSKTMFFILEKVKETIFNFSQEIVKLL